MTSDQGTDGTGIRIIPPFVFLGALVIAIVLDLIWPTRVGLPDWARWFLGSLMILAPFLILPSVGRSFRRAGVRYDVRHTPRALVTEGAFRYSRNPGYGLAVVFCAGIGLATNNPWVFLALVPAMAIVHFGVVLKEEAVLEKQFGEDYLQYKRRVRRWI